MITVHSDIERLKAEYEARRERFAGRDTYSLRNRGHLYTVQQRQRAMFQMLVEQKFIPLHGKRILEVGCGDGSILQEFVALGAVPERLFGIDLIHWKIASANTPFSDTSVIQADGRYLPYLDGAFDLVLQFTMFTSVLDQQIKQNIAREMMRVLKPDGLILWYDFWLNPLNPQTRGIRPAEVRLLFPNCFHFFKRITLAPPIARSFARLSWTGCYLLESIRLFNTHYLAAIRPKINE